jgi:hypothetical protein
MATKASKNGFLGLMLQEWMITKCYTNEPVTAAEIKLITRETIMAVN